VGKEQKGGYLPSAPISYTHQKELRNPQKKNKKKKLQLGRIRGVSDRMCRGKKTFHWPPERKRKRRRKEKSARCQRGKRKKIVNMGPKGKKGDLTKRR